MRRLGRDLNTAGAAAGHFGATLVEVLMAILVFGVGIVSVFSLFPISILRSVQATQLTHASNVRHNGQAALRSAPLVLDLSLPYLPPSPSPQLPVVIGGQTFNFRGVWQPSTVYNDRDIVVPVPKAGSSLPVPDRWFVAITGMAPPISGTTEPIPWALSPNPTPDGGITWWTFPWWWTAAAAGPSISDLNYVFDPIGWNALGNDGSAPHNEFGNRTNRATGLGLSVTTAGGTPIIRVNGGLNTLPAASQLMAGLDSWTTLLETQPLNVAHNLTTTPTQTRITLPPTVDLSVLAGIPVRFVVTGTRGASCVRSNYSQFSANTIDIKPAVPLSLRAPGDIGQVRFETYDRQYTWLATVRKTEQGERTVEVVVFFNRALSAADEHVYNADFGFAGVDKARIQWDVTNEPDPLIREGNYVFDAEHVRWHRIQEIVERQTAGNIVTITLTLTKNPDDATTSGPFTGGAMLMRGIVDIQTIQESQKP